MSLLASTGGTVTGTQAAGADFRTALLALPDGQPIGEQCPRTADVGVAPPGPPVPADVAQQPGPAAVRTTDDSVVHQPLLSIGN